MSFSTAIFDRKRNILLIQLGDIGDVVLTTPTIRAIKAKYPEARVSVLVFKPYGSLLAADPHLHEVVEIARLRGPLFQRLRGSIAFAKLLRSKHYDLTIDLRTGDRGAILSFLTGAPVRVGRQGVTNQFWHGIVFTQTIRELKVAPLPVHPGADQSLRVVRELGIDTEDSTPKLYINPEVLLSARSLLVSAGVAPENGMVTINPFSRWKYKEWSNARWSEVIDRIWNEYRIPVVLIGSREETIGCQSIIAGREGRAFNLSGKTTLGELAAVISMSSLHLGVDSAAPHIAAAVGTPTVTIHGPTDWRGWRIVDEQNKVVTPANDCLPCNKMGCENSGRSTCLEELTADRVLMAADEILLNFNKINRP